MQQKYSTCILGRFRNLYIAPLPLANKRTVTIHPHIMETFSARLATWRQRVLRDRSLIKGRGGGGLQNCRASEVLPLQKWEGLGY